MTRTTNSSKASKGLRVAGGLGEPSGGHRVEPTGYSDPDKQEKASGETVKEPTMEPTIGGVNPVVDVDWEDTKATSGARGTETPRPREELDGSWKLGRAVEASGATFELTGNEPSGAPPDKPLAWGEVARVGEAAVSVGHHDGGRQMPATPSDSRRKLDSGGPTARGVESIVASATVLMCADLRHIVASRDNDPPVRLWVGGSREKTIDGDVAFENMNGG